MDDHGIAVRDVSLEKLLACPRCHGGLRQETDGLRCTGAACGFRAAIANGIVSASAGGSGPSFFDSAFPVMIHGSDQPGPRRTFYEQQIAALEARLPRTGVVLDVGCGPRIGYARAPGTVLIGLDMSYESLKHNGDVDVRVHGSATALPVPSASVDAVVCFYSLHHFVGKTTADNEALMRAAFREFGRALKPTGDLVVFEVAPWVPVWNIQTVAWNAMRRALGTSFDMYFWGRQALTRLAADELPRGSALTYRAFRIPPFTTFPPAFAVQWLRIPRVLYPFHLCMYHWRMA